VAITREKKQEIMQKLKGALDSSKSLVFVNFHGLTVSGINELRRTLRSAGVSYFVAKKNLVKKVLGEGSVSGTMPELPGELALAFSDDLISPAREIYGFQKKTPDNLKIVGGIFDGRFMNQIDMMEIAMIPTLPVLHGKFVNIINSPIQRFVIGLNEIAKLKN